MSGGEENPVTEAELHAWIDGELPESRRRAVEAHLESHPEDARRIESYRRHGATMARLLAPLIDRPVPERLRNPPARAAGTLRRRLVAAAAAVLLFAAGAASGWMAREFGDSGGRSGDRLVADAATAHVVYAAEVRHPVEVAADEEAHLTAWLSKRLGAPISAPRLDEAGFHLVGGRLLPGADGPAAQFMYQDETGRRVTLYVRPEPSARETSFRFAEAGEVAAFYWRDRGLSWALLGELDRDRLLGLAHRAYADLTA